MPDYDVEVLDALGRVIPHRRAPAPKHHARPKKKAAPARHHAALHPTTVHHVVRALAKKHPTAPHHALVAAVHRAAAKKAASPSSSSSSASAPADGPAMDVPDDGSEMPDTGDAGGAEPSDDSAPADEGAPPEDDGAGDDESSDDAPADDSTPEEDAVSALECCDDDLNGFFDFIAAPFKAIVKVATAPIHLIEKIPVIGKPFHAVMDVAGVHLADRIASGERLDHALLNNFKDTLHGIHDLAPYASTVVSFVPGIGTGFAAAIAAGAALAEGRSITDAAVAAVKGALPGGQLASTGFDAAWKIAHGANVSKVALEAARANLPPAAQKAFDVGLAVATGKSLQNAIVAALGALTPDQAKVILDEGTKAIAVTKGLADVAKHLANAQQQKGFQLAAGLLAHKGVNTALLGKARGSVTGDVRKGFDALLHAQEQHSPVAKEALHGPDQKTRIANATAEIDPAKLVKKVDGKPALLLPATLAATTALIVADRAMRVASGERGTPKQRKAMSDAIVWTNALAHKKNADAARTLKYMTLAKNVRGAKEAGGKPVAHPPTKAKPNAPKPSEPKKAASAADLLVHANGIVERGAFRKVTKGTKGAVFGPLVSGRRVTRGYFVRSS